jgi:translation elongation factor EF-G
MSEKAAVWIQCHQSVVGKVYAEVVRQSGVIQRQTQGGELCSILVRVPQVARGALEEAVAKLHDSVVVTPA